MLRWFLVLLLLVVTSLSGGSREPYGLAVMDELKQLDRIGLEQAAQPLLKRGAAVAVVLVQHGSQQDAVKQLAQLGLLNGSQISPSGLYLYVSLDPHYSELRAGSRFSDNLPASQLEKVRDQSLNPQLRGEHYQLAFVDSLTELERRLSHRLSLNNCLALVPLGLASLYLLLLFGFWDWFCGTPPGRGLLWLWSLTPAARAQQRRELEKARLAQLQLLQTRAESLADFRQSMKMFLCPRKAEFEQLQQQVKAATGWASPQLAELRTRVEAETQHLQKLYQHINAGTRELVETRGMLQSIRSALKARKKTRPLLQSPEMQALEAELEQESELRRRYGSEGADLEEWELSEARCQTLHRSARERAAIYCVLKKNSPASRSQTSWTADSSTSETSSSYSSPSSSYEDRGSSYEPPESSSESWAGGSW